MFKAVFVFVLMSMQADGSNKMERVEVRDLTVKECNQRVNEKMDWALLNLPVDTSMLVECRVNRESQF
jgi:hypothetical protein